MSISLHSVYSSNLLYGEGSYESAAGVLWDESGTAYNHLQVSEDGIWCVLEGICTGSPGAERWSLSAWPSGYCQATPSCCRVYSLRTGNLVAE